MFIDFMHAVGKLGERRDGFYNGALKQFLEKFLGTKIIYKVKIWDYRAGPGVWFCRDTRVYLNKGFIKPMLLSISSRMYGTEMQSGLSGVLEEYIITFNKKKFLKEGYNETQIKKISEGLAPLFNEFLNKRIAPKEKLRWEYKFETKLG